jgi:hypothetical protein
MSSLASLRLEKVHRHRRSRRHKPSFRTNEVAHLWRLHSWRLSVYRHTGEMQSFGVCV